MSQDSDPIRSILPSVKQAICAALLSIAFPVSGTSQESSPVVNLVNSIVCRDDTSNKVGCITPPRQTHSPEPKYPRNERKARHQGLVRLKLVVGSDGVPRDIAVSQTLSSDFDHAAIEAVKRWKFSPAMKDGKPVPVEIAIEIEFHLH